MYAAVGRSAGGRSVEGDGRIKRVGVRDCTEREHRGDGGEEGESSGRGMSVEERVEQSKVHWSVLAEFDNGEGEEEAEVSNVKEFEELQRHPVWGTFFYKFNRGDGSTLEVGEEFAEGAQAELFHCYVNWANPKDLEKGTELVLKVFKKGTFLRHLKSQLPQGLLQFHAAERKNWRSPTPKLLPRYYCEVYRGTLLEDGRFAFLMEKEHFDLRSLIDREMKSKGGEGGGPFSKEDAEAMMYGVALGVEWLHYHGIVHRDLKASNVLVKELKSTWPKWRAFEADYECPIGVVGMGFFRAPEILEACKDCKVWERPEVFSRAADIYSYGMVCYEILTRKLPFEDHPLYDYAHVLNGNQPILLKYVEKWMHDMLVWCWKLDPKGRPTIGEILNILMSNSDVVEGWEEWRKKRYGGRHKWKYEFEEISFVKAVP